MIATIAIQFVLWFSGVFALHATEPTPSQLEFFENNIRPLLSEHCYSCHSSQAERVKGGLLLDSREGVLQGGDDGLVLVPGNPDKSQMIIAVRYSDPDLQMPPKGKHLSEREVSLLEQWVKMGAPDPREAPSTAYQPSDGKDHWAWQPLKEPAVPSVKDKSWGKDPVDAFVLAKLEQQGMQPAAPADRRTLIRRAYFDLIGLPPSPEQVEAFLGDPSPDAFAKVVDELLASPHYGERWGRHWLDVARYSDTKGEVRRFREDPNNPHAWEYRDYVIRSFNEDKPFNEFILEQIVADQLPATKTNRDLLAALGFLTVGDHYMGMRNDILNDEIDVVTKGFLGLTVSCARCHDHKFDPIPQADYYSLYGVFASTTEPKTLPVISQIRNTPEYREYHEQLKTLMEQRNDLEAEFVKARRNRDRDTLRQLRRRSTRNLRELSDLEMTHPGAPERAMAVEDVARPRDANLLIRGEAGHRGPKVPRQFLEVIAGQQRRPFTHGSGRLDLARAIIDPSNPLTPRVLVNRVWQHHFGAGLVPTPDDLGMMCEPPSHPALLDYLASRFVKEGWSIKRLHREILLSATWQQSSRGNPQFMAEDPENRLLSHQNIQRLEIEPIRDALLALGGVLDTNLYGKPFDLTADPTNPRRTVYARIDRQRVPEAFAQFDFASPDMETGRRHTTTVPQQMLFFMNNPLVIQVARMVVERQVFVAHSSDQARVKKLYELLYQREPTPKEMTLALAFLKERPASGDSEDARSMRSGRTASVKGQNPARPLLTGWQEYAHALLLANEFIYLQ